MQDYHTGEAWVTFCMSTYKRPVLLKNALKLIAKQTFRNFEVVVSDNDPEGSAKPVVESFNDKRFRYFFNEEDLGMIRSYNKSIERASTPFIVMITDDDPVSDNLLEELFQLHNQYKGHSIYCGFQRKHVSPGTVEVISGNDFISEILDVNKTPSILWSSCVMKRKAVLEVGKLADTGSPALVDHVLISTVGSLEGGVVINKMYSTNVSHDNNFSKFNLHFYTSGCIGFHEKMIEFCQNHKHFSREKKQIEQHLGHWFIVSIYNLKRFHTVKKNELLLKQVDECVAEILALPYMKRFAFRFRVKGFVFSLKKRLNLLK